MTCPTCKAETKRFGKDRKGNQRFRCSECGKTFSVRPENNLDGMYLPMEKAVHVIQLLLEGCSVSSVERVTGIHHGTILKLLVIAGEKCERIMAREIVNVPVQDVECDEIWGFIRKKEGHKGPKEAHDNSIGDAYCFVGIERNSKLVLNFALGRRDNATTEIFIEGLRHATGRTPFQITTDGFSSYRNAISDTLGDRVDFAQLIKVYRQPEGNEARYSPAEVASTEVVPVMGNPDPARICTSIVERSNLTMRMQMRRLTRLTNGFSKKWENHWAALCLYFCWYNFVRYHRSIRCTPAMAAGITHRIWGIADLLA